MTLSERYIFDVPVYRLPEDKYYREMDRHIDRTLFPVEDPLSNTLRKMEVAGTVDNATLRGHIAKKYGGCWRFNEIVGYIRLFFLGTQVRGEYFTIGQQRICRTRHKVFELKSMKLAPEIEIGHLTSNAAIFNAVMEYLSHCRKELKARHVDSEFLEKFGQFMDWQSILHSN